VKKNLDKVGLCRIVNIYASPNGKSSGKIWAIIKKKHIIASHLGDSLHSDVAMAKSCKVSALHYINSQLSRSEKALMTLGQLNLACLMRALRLQTPYPPLFPEYLFWNDQCQINVPTLLEASLYLNDFCQKHHKKRILFTSRDGCLWIQLFKTLYPHYDSIYFHASRYTEHDSKIGFGLKRKLSQFGSAENLIFESRSVYAYATASPSYIAYVSWPRSVRKRKIWISLS
jgi:predicted HAD superfamily hydrolase